MSGILIDLGNSEYKLLSTDATAEITGVHESLLQESEKDIIWYREHFFGKGEVVSFN
jgi:RAP1 GTPase activating protein 1